MLVVSLSGSGGGATRRWTLRFMCKTFVLVREAEGREEEGKGARFIFSRPAREEEMWEEEEEKGEEEEGKGEKEEGKGNAEGKGKEEERKGKEEEGRGGWEGARLSESWLGCSARPGTQSEKVLAVVSLYRKCTVGAHW